MIERSAGILMHITSLPSPHGIGTIGKEAFEFVDFLKSSNMRYWQILPICPPSVGNSPYSAYSSFAGNPLLIDLDLLIDDGLLAKDEVNDIKWYEVDDKVDFDLVIKGREQLFELVAERFDIGNDDYQNFIADNQDWLEDYATFMTLSSIHNDMHWYEWEDEFKNPHSDLTQKTIKDNLEIYQYHLILQYLFYKQWFQLLDYAHQNGILIIGDLPIYVGHNSSDVYGNQKLFKIGLDGIPSEVSGVPPDAYAVDGQKWGNPLYDWDYHKETNYEWWISRVAHHLAVHDVLRIDHFRGFDAYFSIPYDGMAKDGHWEKGPGIEFFDALKAELGDIDLIAEDLGYKTPSLQSLLDQSTYPGMKVLEFAFNSMDNMPSEYLPHRYDTNCIAYVGTHDNDTLLGWFNNAYEGDKKYAKDYFGVKNDEDFARLAIKGLLMSKAKLVVIQVQDILGLDSSSRMNIPSVPKGNWVWRAKKGVFTYDLANDLALEMKLYGRENVR